MSKGTFLNEVKRNLNLTTTENGAVLNTSSLNYLLDFFTLAPSMRKQSDEKIISLFEKAFAEDKERAIKCVFYIGDILHGTGERRCFRLLINHIANTHPECLLENMYLIPEYSRWDSLYELFDTKLELEAVRFMRSRLLLDIKSDKPSLLAKWLKSPNASSPETKALGRKTARLLNLGEFANPDGYKERKCNEKYYRKALSSIRTKLNIIEKNMSEGTWEKVKYEAIPSQAMNRYQNAFYRNDKEGFVDYCIDVENGYSKINSRVLFPHQITSKIANGNIKNRLDRALVNAQWKSLPDFIKGADMKGLCVVDVSGSMHGEPMEAAVGLGLYISERCSGVYKDKFITFSESPELVEVKGSNIVDRVSNMSRADWGYNTNLEKVFDLILQTAIKNNAPQEDIPDCLFILTDMGFDDIQDGTTYDWSFNRNKKAPFVANTFIESMRKRYEDAGYDLPILICWNLKASNSIMPMTADENGWISVSGFSPSIMKAVLSKEVINDDLDKEEISPMRAMLFMLDGLRYSEIRLQ